jgi:glycosyltransferase involved in cell wall biosynthesis
VSIIAMTMNHERFAVQALDAIAAQTFTDVELVITDDASVDSTPTLVTEWLERSGRKATFIAHEENRGICPTLVEATAHTSGEFLAVVALDDIWRPERLATAVQAFDEADDDVALVYSDSDIIDEHGVVQYPSFMDTFTRFGQSADPPPTGDVFEELVRSNFVCALTATSRRAVVESVGGYDAFLPLEDWGMWLKLAAEHRFAYVDACLGSYRVLETGYWRQMVRHRAVRPCAFDTLANVFGKRADVDPLIRERLRDLVETMVANEDEGAAERSATLREIDPPVRLEPTRPRSDKVASAADLVGRGYSITEVDDAGVVLFPTASKILYLAPWLTVGGADRGTIDWFRHIGRDAFERLLVTTEASDNALYAEAEALADEAWCLPEISDREAVPHFVLDLVANRGVDLVHVMNSKAGFDLIPALKSSFPDVPVVAQFHADESGGGYPRYVVSRYDTLVDAYSVISEEMRRQLVAHHVSPSKIEVIYLGVDAADFDPERAGPRIALDAGRFHVLFAARLAPQKRPEMVLDIAAAIRRTLPAAQFHIVGDGPLRPGLEQRAVELDLGDLVVFHGASDNMWGWYDACDVSLLCSTFEGIPLVIFEAMSMEVPTVTPLIGGIGEVVDETTGVGLDRLAGVDTYAAALVALANDPARRQAIGRAARHLVLDRYRVETMGIQHRDLYGRLIARTRIRQ